MKTPHIYRAINAVAADLAVVGIPKGGFNEQEQYSYRSIDDVLQQLAPVLARRSLCILPRAVERCESQRGGKEPGSRLAVTLRVAFDLVSSRDGSRHTIEVFGEAIDEGDKATAKAMTAAYKSAVLQAFCVPVAGQSEPEATTGAKPGRVHESEPVQGWEQWCRELIETIGICQTDEALQRVQNTNRAQLKAISREQNTLYVRIGQAFADRRIELARAEVRPLPKKARQTPVRAEIPEAEAKEQVCA